MLLTTETSGEEQRVNHDDIGYAMTELVIVTGIISNRNHAHKSRQPNS